ncbi:alpha-hydroxy acid oxidase [Sphingobium sp. Ndbn-10]|uniref:alpha-hydroxy acid oxidase n=1 Tax=Sphingobium sp. Ndbn-10 TaxID=1667223 RepID=UPI0009F1E28B|nr:alpha-hydroxy acid oxidase [Sphingobium sp. Ndbn-10]
MLANALKRADVPADDPSGGTHEPLGRWQGMKDSTSSRQDALALGQALHRRFYTGANLSRMRSIGDLRARAYKLMPRFVLEYLEGGAEDEATLSRERAAFADWRFMPRQLVDVTGRTLEGSILSKFASMPLAIAPTGLNGLFCENGDMMLAQGAAAANVPFIQSTMSNDRMEDVATISGLRHWWQLYMFGPDEIWQELLRRAEACNVEALVLTTNAQIFGDREWDARTRINRSMPSAATIFDAMLHPRWAATTLSRGMPVFRNIIDFVPRNRRSFFDSAFWIRKQMTKSLTWRDVTRIRQRWRGPFLLKGLLNLEDVRVALDSGVDGVILGSHGGRQADWAVSALDILPQAREIVGDRITLMMSGGIRRGTDLLKALALGADAVLAGRAPLYGLCAAGAEGVTRALELLHDEALDEMGQLGVISRADLTPKLLISAEEGFRPSA